MQSLVSDSYIRPNRFRRSASSCELASEADAPLGSSKEEEKRQTHKLRKKQRSRSTSPPPRKPLGASFAPLPAEEEVETEMEASSHIVHRVCRAAPLSPELSEQQNFRGLINLGGLIVFVTNFRLIVENLLKYGLLIKFDGALWTSWRAWPCCSTLIGMNVFILLGYLVERCMATTSHKRERVRPPSMEKWAAWLHWVNITTMFFVVLFVIQYNNVDPMSAFALLAAAISLIMKLISYAAVNKDLRSQARSRKQLTNQVRIPGAMGLRYPENITIGNLYYFIAAPTLCYQMEYPRTSHIRWGHLAALALRSLFLNLLILFMVEQYLVPIVKNSIEPLTQMHFGHLLERLLKLSIPNLYIWLLFFYSFFHCWLNMLAEVLRFGDREFYQDWWNSTTLSEYWRTWNRPVHQWLLRHVYYPMTRAGFSKLQSAFFIFFLSGVGHEVLVSIPCNTFQLWVLGSFIAQLPLIFITRRFMKGTKLGNLVFWFSFCILGQPMCILLYTHLVYHRYQFFYWKYV
jgi:diacylglycerol O-acyltransferase-1